MYFVNQSRVNVTCKSNLLEGVITIRTGCFISLSYIYSPTLEFYDNQLSVLRVPFGSLKRVGKARWPSGTIHSAAVWWLHEDLVAEWTRVGGAWRMCGALLATPNRPQRRVLTEHKQDISWIFAVVLYLDRHLTWSCEGGGSEGRGWWRIGRKRRQVEGRSYSTHLRPLEHCPTNKLREHKRNKPTINKRI